MQVFVHGFKMTLPNFRGCFPYGLTRRQIGEVGELINLIGINDSIPHTVVNKSVHLESFTLEGDLLLYAFRLSSVSVLVAWHDIKPSYRIGLCAFHVEH